jgi:hypothetical protein
MKQAIHAIRHTGKSSGDAEWARRRAPMRGLGDVVEWVARRTGLQWLAVWWERRTGKPCGCDRRREALNKLIPFGEPKHE